MSEAIDIARRKANHLAATRSRTGGTMSEDAMDACPRCAELRGRAVRMESIFVGQKRTAYECPSCDYVIPLFPMDVTVGALHMDELVAADKRAQWCIANHALIDALMRKPPEELAEDDGRQGANMPFGAMSPRLLHVWARLEWIIANLVTIDALMARTKVAVPVEITEEQAGALMGEMLHHALMISNSYLRLIWREGVKIATLPNPGAAEVG